MTVTSALASFAVVAAVLTISPGLDTALVLRATLAQGRAAGFATGAGISTGTLTWGAASAAGVSALLTASHLAFTVLRLAGAAYLLWLGAGMLLRSLRRAPAVRGEAGDGAGPVLAAGVAAAAAGGSIGGAWRRGLLTNLLNPKIGVFYVVMIPQFLPVGASHLLMGLALAGVHVVEGMVWFSGLILLTSLARRWLAGARTRRTVELLTGAVLVGFGLRLVATS